MSRPSSPPSPARALAAGAVVLVLALGLASLRLWAAPQAPEAPAAVVTVEDPPAKPPAPPPPRPPEPAPREALRYDGKSFEQWRRELQTELKPAVVADGMKAMAAFGANGYGTEAARAILVLMRAHDVERSGDPDNWVVVKAALGALAQIGDPAGPALREGIKDRSQNVRRCAAEGLASRPTWAGAAVPELLAATRDPDVYVRWKAVEALGLVQPPPPGYLAILLKRLQDPDPYEDSNVRNAAVINVGRLGPAGRSATPLLVGLLDKNSGRLRWNVIDALVKIKAEPAKAVPALVRVLQHPDWNLEGVAARALGTYGPEAAPAVPALTAALKRAIKGRAGSNTFDDIVQALARIGPAARPAVPLLKEYQKYNGVGVPTDPVTEALKQIEK